MRDRYMVACVLLSLAFSGCAVDGKKSAGRKAEPPAVVVVEKQLAEAEGQPAGEKPGPGDSSGQDMPSREEGSLRVIGEKYYTLDDIKAMLFKGESPDWFNGELARDLFGEPYVKYASDTEIMDIWFYEDFYLGFNGQGRVVKASADEKERKRLLESHVDRQGALKVK